jgi:hypothetical protein
MAFATLAEAKTQLNFPTSDTSKDTELQFYLDAATARLEDMVGQSASASRSERLYSISNRMRTTFRPVTGITSITAVESSLTVASTDLVIEHASAGIVRRINWQAFSGWYDLVYSGGYTSILANHKLACLITFQHLWQLQNGRGRPASGEDGFPPLGGFAIPNRALELLYDTPAMAVGFG